MATLVRVCSVCRMHASPRREHSHPRRWALRVALALFALFVLIQFVPVDRGDPRIVAVPADVGPPEVMAVLRRSCFDCHSNETVWPWYGRVAPASWLVARDVRMGRDELNFSTWSAMSAKERAEAARESHESAFAGEMPMRIYLLMHPDARLSAADYAALETWARTTTLSGVRSDDDD